MIQLALFLEAEVESQMYRVTASTANKLRRRSAGCGGRTSHRAAS